MPAGDELPPVVAKFIADITQFTAPIETAIASLDQFQKKLDDAVGTAQSFGAAVADAAGGATASMRAAESAAKDEALAETELAAATKAASTAADRQRDSELGAAASMMAAKAAADAETASALKAAAAQETASKVQASAGPQMRDLIKTMDSLTAAQEKMAQSAHDAEEATSFWKKHFELSGGLFGSIPILGFVSGIELVLHSLMEVAAVAIPAITTATAGIIGWGVAAYAAGKQVFMQFYNLSTVGKALNQTIKPLTGGFAALSNAVRPQVFELLGTYLDSASRSGGAFQELIMSTGRYIDHTFAALEVHLSKGGDGLRNFFQAGATDLKLFGEIFNNVGKFIVAFADAAMKTHIAEILLSILAAASQVIALLAKIPAPLLTAFVAIHGAALWGGLAVTQLKNAALGLVGAMAKVDALNSPMVGFAQAIGASTDRLIKMKAESPALKSIADDIAAGVPGAWDLTKAFEQSDASLAKLVSRSSMVKTVASAVGASAEEVASFAVAMSKGGVSVEQLAAKTAGGTAELSKITAGLEKSAADAANLALAFKATGRGTVEAGKAAEGAAAGMAKMGVSAGEAAASGGMLSGALSNIGSAVPGGPVVWFGLLAAAIAGVGVYLGMQPDATQRWINSLNQSVQASSNLNILGNTVAALAADTTQLGEAQRTATGNTTELAGTQRGLTQDLQTELQHVGQVQKAYGVSMPQALALLQTAGVKATDLFKAQGDAWATDLEMVHGLTAGYAAMGQQIGAVGSDMNALAVAQSSQLSAMQNLNSAYDNFTQIVAGPMTGILDLASGLQTFAKDATAVGSSMTGLGKNSITLQQQFQSVYSSTEKLFDSFRSAQAISPTSGGDDFTKFVKDAVAALLPLAGTSSSALAQVSALAQEAGGPATGSMKDLAKWAGNIKNPLEDMYKASEKATKGAADLNQDAAKLSSSLQSALNPAITQATLNALGGQKSLTDFATAIHDTGTKSDATFQAGKKVAEMFLSIDGNSKSAEAQFVGWVESMGYSKKAAETLWSSVSKGEKPLESVRKSLASTAQATKDLGKPGLWGQFEHQVMAMANNVKHWFMDMGHNVRETWDKIWPQLTGSVSREFHKIISSITAIWDPWWKEHGAQVVQVSKQMWSDVMKVFHTYWPLIMGYLNASWEILKGAWKAVWAIMGGILKAAWDTIRIVTTTAWKVITTLLSTGFKQLLDVIGIFLDLATGKWGKAWHDLVKLFRDTWDGLRSIVVDVGKGLVDLIYNVGKDLVMGLIHGIEDSFGGAFNAIKSLGSGVVGTFKSMLGISSPSKEFYILGAQITAGLASGIASTKAEALAESQTLAREITNAAYLGELTGAQEASLRKQLGKALSTGLSAGVTTQLTGTTTQIQNEIKKLDSAVGNALAGGMISSGEASRLTGWLQADNTKLQSLANQRTKIANEIKQAQQFAVQTASSITSGYGLSQIMVGSKSGQLTSVSGIIGNLAGDLKQLRAFKTNLLKLSKMGFNKAYLNQLIQMGPIQGGALAAELAGAGLDQINQINKAEHAISGLAGQLGKQAADEMYDSGKMAGKGFLSGLEAQQAAITAMMQKIAKAMIATLKKELGIKSPSSVMASHGMMVAEGFAQGIEKGTQRVMAAAHGLSGAVAAGTGPALVGRHTGGGDIVINLNSKVSGEVNQQVLWSAVQRETFRYNIRNAGTVTGTMRPGTKV